MSFIWYRWILNTYIEHLSMWMGEHNSWFSSAQAIVHNTIDHHQPNPPLRSTLNSISNSISIYAISYQLSAKLTIEHVRTCTKAHILDIRQTMPKRQTNRFWFSFGFTFFDCCKKKATTHYDAAHFHSLFNIKFTVKIYIRTFYNDVINGDTGAAVSFYCVLAGMELLSLWPMYIRCVVDFLLFFPLLRAVIFVVVLKQHNFCLRFTARRHIELSANV